MHSTTIDGKKYPPSHSKFSLVWLLILIVITISVGIWTGFRMKKEIVPLKYSGFKFY